MARATLPILILAAGASSRMRGRDKLLEDIDGIPLLRHQAQKACAATRGKVLITLPKRPHPRYETVKDLPVQTIPVSDAADGMSASLRAGIAALPSETQTVMVLLADLPDITVDDLCTVAKAVDLSTDTLIWRGATQEGAPGHPTVFRAPLFKKIEALQGDTGGRALMELARGQITLVPLPDNHARCDLDTPEDWDAWRAARQNRSPDNK